MPQPVVKPVAAIVPKANEAPKSGDRPRSTEIRSDAPRGSGGISTSTPPNKSVASDLPKSGGSPKTEAAKSAAERVTPGDVRKMIPAGPGSTPTARTLVETSAKGKGLESSKGPDASKGTAKIEPKTSKLPADRPSIFDIRKRVEDGKSSKPGTSDAVGKSGAGKTGSDKIGSGKSGSGDAGKTGKGPALVGPDKSKLPDVGKAKLPDVGKAKLPDIGKSKLPDVGKAKLPDVGKAKLPDIGKSKLPDAGKAKLPGGLPKAGDIGKPGGVSPKDSTMKLIDRGGPAAGGVKPGGVSSKINFPDRVKKGDLDRITAGAVAKKINLSEQYKMSLQGDVARRAQLNSHLTGVHVTHATASFFHSHPHYAYRGWVHPGFRTYAFQSHWHLPYFYVDFCWYPRWSPWVNWCWYYPVRPFWDPRPIWCRPVVYIDATPWVYWQTPVWVALPSVPSGTWVDVPPAVVPAAQYDLQVLAVRFVDPGHPDQKLGPRYRVWFRNNSGQPITQPFNVLLLASADGQVRQNLPQAGVRVTAVEAGDTQSVDVRLPFEVTTAVPAASATFQVIVDSNREINDVNRANNGAKVAQADILPVDPAAFEVEPASVPAGGELIVAGEGLGPEPGKVLVHLGGIEMEAQVLGWYDLGVRVAAPNLPLAGPTEAEFIVVRGDGAAANPVKVTITPPVVGQPAGAAVPVPPPPAPQP